MTEVERYPIAHRLDLQLAVLRCQRSALLQGVSDLERSVIATIVSELGSNILKYAPPGRVAVRHLRRGGVVELEISASDDGPGIANLDLALTEHYSSGRTLGLGLSGVKRMADHFHIESSPAAGTTVVVRKRLNLLAGARHERDTPQLPLSLHGNHWALAAAVQARRGARLSGDHVLAIQRGQVLLLSIIDATGHGTAAHGLATRLGASLADAVAHGPETPDPCALLRTLHNRCAGTPGAAAAIALIDEQHGSLRYLAVGNVRAAVVGEQRFRGVSRDGVLGRRWPTPFIQQSRLAAGDQLLMWTDGLPENLTASLTPDTLANPSLTHANASILTDHARDHDDAACLMLRWQP